MSSGSLGQGLSFGIGVALAGKLDQRDYRVYVLLGDGECEEGQIWEAAMLAAHFNLDNLMAIVDNNGLQIDGTVEELAGLEPLAGKWRAFGWNVVEVDGHDFPELMAAFKKASECVGKPTVVIARTIKGRGVSFMENNLDFHGRAPNAEELAQALGELA
jgi:transketolase